MVEIWQCIKKMSNNPTTTIIYFEEFGQHGAPSITVCAYSDHLGTGTSYRRKMLARHGLTLHDYAREGIWWSNMSGVTPEQVYQDITWALEDLVDRVEYTFKETRFTLSARNSSWKNLWTVTNRKWEGRCFTFNPTPEMSQKGLLDIHIISKFQFDLEISFHEENQSTDKELDGISFRAMYRQYYILEVPVDIIINRDTANIPCAQETENFDKKRNKIAVDKMIADLGCVVPFIERNETNEKICTSKNLSKTAVEIFEATGKYFDLFNWNQVPQPCQQIHVEPRKVFESPEWDNQTWINAKFLKTSKVTQQIPSYSFTSFYAEVGGFVGLLLGVSLHQVSRILDFIPYI